MTLSRTIDRRVAAFAIFAGIVVVAFVAQNAAISSPAPLRSDSLPVLASLPLAPTTADVAAAITVPESRVAAVNNACETENWPYCSKGCLRGEAAAPAPRQVHLQPASTTQTPRSAPINVALADTSARQASEQHQLSEVPRRRKLRQIQRYASRPMLRVRLTPQPEPGEFGQVLAFSW